MNGECSLSEAAQWLGIGKTRMSYWVNKLLGLGLIEQLRIEKRGRNMVPVYRATADRFVVPMDKVPVESDEQILEIQSKGFEEAAQRAVMGMIRRHDHDWDMEYDLLNTKGQLNLTPKNNPIQELPGLASFGVIQLPEEVAKKAMLELRELMMRYIQLEVPEGKRYLYQILVVEETP